MSRYKHDNDDDDYTEEDDHIVVDNETFVMVAAALNDVPLPLNGPTTITNKKKSFKICIIMGLSC